ncbi:hypothetical protein LAY57_07485 [Argonema antarcticum A004/B2]|nr:hypothetical protein [Argonema antarcticum A004/B2]
MICDRVRGDRTFWVAQIELQEALKSSLTQTLVPTHSPFGAAMALKKATCSAAILQVTL